ncbi:retrovirus-related pol polyprotein from transposon TNT 1-94, partial [Tanacetum coccineum]
CDNGGEFRNKETDDFCSRKGIKREFSNARTPQQNKVAERRNRTLIEATRTMLADAKLHVTFLAEAVNTACYVQNRVLVTKPLNKTPYELFNGRAPAIGFLRPFGCHVMILNTLDHLGKFDAKGDEGFFVGYSLNSKAFRVYNKRTKHIEENLHINFLESKVIDKAGGPNWFFDIESLIMSMNYIPVVRAGTSSSNISGTKEDVKQAEKEKGSLLRFIALSPVADEIVPPTRGDRYGEAFPTATSLDAGQDRENIPKTSAIPYELSPRVTSLGSDEGSLQLKLNELMDFYTKLQREDFSIEKDSNKSTDKGSESTREMVNVLSSMGASNILASGGLKEVFTAASPPVPPISLFVSTVVATTSEKDSTAAVITTTTAVTPYTRRTRASRGVVMTSSSPIPINIPSISKEDKGK